MIGYCHNVVPARLRMQAGRPRVFYGGYWYLVFGYWILVNGSLSIIHLPRYVLR